jgi:monoamine oxidase
MVFSFFSWCIAASTSGEILDADVLIIGAGWAGFGAADHFGSNNFSSYLVLEGSNRTGGRTHALPDFGHDSVGKYVIERGSNWISGVGGGASLNHKKEGAPNVKEHPMLVLANKVGVKLTYIYGSSQNMSNYGAVYDTNGVNADPDGALRRKANQAYDCLNTSAPKAPIDETVREAMQKCGWDPKTDVEWAMDWVLTEDDPGMPAEIQSANDVLPDETYQWWGADDWFVIDQHPRGWARVIDELYIDKTVPKEKIVFDAMVTTIKYDCNSVTVSTADGRTFTAKEVISTLPIGSLKRNHRSLFSPNLPSNFTDLLDADQIVMANLTHVLFQFPSVWWDNTLPRWVNANEGSSQNISLAGEFCEWQNLNHDSMIPGSQTLLSFLGDPQSSYYEGLTDAEVQAAAMARIRLQNPKLTIPDPVAFFISRHGYDPLSYGAYSGFEPGWKDKFYKVLNENIKSCGETRIRFAGEAMCDDLSGYTHGGLQSGRETAAKYLHKAGLGPKPCATDDLCICDY